VIDIADDELNITQKRLYMLLITVKAVMFVTKILYYSFSALFVGAHQLFTLL